MDDQNPTPEDLQNAAASIEGQLGPPVGKIPADQEAARASGELIPATRDLTNPPPQDSASGELAIRLDAIEQVVGDLNRRLAREESDIRAGEPRAPGAPGAQDLARVRAMLSPYTVQLAKHDRQALAALPQEPLQRARETLLAAQLSTDQTHQQASSEKPSRPIGDSKPPGSFTPVVIPATRDTLPPPAREQAPAPVLPVNVPPAISQSPGSTASPAPAGPPRPPDPVIARAVETLERTTQAPTESPQAPAISTPPTTSPTSSGGLFRRMLSSVTRAIGMSRAQDQRQDQAIDDVAVEDPAELARQIAREQDPGIVRPDPRAASTALPSAAVPDQLPLPHPTAGSADPPVLWLAKTPPADRPLAADQPAREQPDTAKRAANDLPATSGTSPPAQPTDAAEPAQRPAVPPSDRDLARHEESIARPQAQVVIDLDPKTDERSTAQASPVNPQSPAPPLPRWTDYFQASRDQQRGPVRSAIAATIEYTRDRIQSPEIVDAEIAAPSAAAPTHYELLGVPPTATPDEILIAYEEKRKAAGSLEEREPLAQATRALLKPETRQAYDQQLAEQQRPPPPEADPTPSVPVATDAGTARPAADFPQLQTQTGADRGGQSPPPPTSTAAPPDDDEPRPTWRKNFDRRRAEGQGRARAAAGAALDSVEDRVIDWQIEREDRRSPAERAAAIDREAQRAGGTTPTQHPLVEAAGRALASDQDLSTRTQEQFREAQVQDQVPRGITSPEEFYASQNLGYRPGDPRAKTQAERRDRSDDAGRTWEQVGAPAIPSREQAAERLTRTRQDLQAGIPLAPDQEPLAEELRRRPDLTAPDAYVIQQRQAHGAPTSVVPSPTPPQSWIAEQWYKTKQSLFGGPGGGPGKVQGGAFGMPGGGPSGPESPGGSMGRAMTGYAYGQAAQMLGSIGGEVTSNYGEFFADRATAGVISGVAGTASGAIGKIGGGAAAGFSVGGPVGAVVGGAAGIGATVSELPAKLMEWSEALVDSRKDLELWSGQLQAFALEKQVREYQRDIQSAQATGGATVGLGKAIQDLKDELRPINDNLYKAVTLLAQWGVTGAKIADDLWAVKEKQIGSIPFFIRVLSEINDKLNPTSQDQTIVKRWAEAWRNLDIRSSRVP